LPPDLGQSGKNNKIVNRYDLGLDR
jgi:hypothetical protein